jgi:hypothetical protein
MTKNDRSLTLLVAGALLGLPACGNSGSSSNDGSGLPDAHGAARAAGSNANGGARASAGSSGSGGQAGSGGGAGGATSGSAGGGRSTASGGAASSGGNTGAGGATATGDSGARGSGGASSGIQTVYIVLEENHPWSAIKGNANAPFMNGLLATAAHSEQFYTPLTLHPSEPNYVWLEGGSNFGLTTDADSSATNLVKGKPHLVQLLSAAGISWKSYQDGISGTTCPIKSANRYAAKHDPMIFFDDVVGNPPSATNAYCLAHHGSTSTLDTDVKNGTTARYNFITPNLDNDMHDGTIRQADDWLKAHVGPIISSPTLMAHAAVFITWDEGSGNEADGPIGMIVVSPFAKPGYADTAKPVPYYYTHSSTLLTFQKIFGVSQTPLGDAGKAGTHDLSDLFTTFP